MGSMCDCTLRQQVKNTSVQQLCIEKMWCQKIKFLANKMPSLNKEEKSLFSPVMFATDPSFDLTSSCCLVASVMTKMNASSLQKKIVSPSCASFKSAIVFFEAFKVLIKPLPDFLPKRVRFLSISSDCWMFVMQSFAFVLRFYKVTALIQWPLNILCTQRKFPGFLVPTSCHVSHVGMIFQRDCIILTDLFLSPPNI